MLGNLSGGEILILLVVLLLVFGAHGLPGAGKAVGNGMRQIRRALDETRAGLEPDGNPPAAGPSAARPARRLID